ncbi:MAG: hypothetical protein H6701_04795 [Myxococcales bacterium]|nr:hypothetical protein [Myxococcales bacterium]
MSGRLRATSLPRRSILASPHAAWTRRLAPLTALALVVLAGAAEARVRWSTPGAYRLRVTGLSPFALDARGGDSGQRYLGEHRLRIQPMIEAGPVFVQMEIDVLTGQVFGDPLAVGAAFAERRHGDPQDPYDGWTTVEPRQLWAEVATPYATLRLGQMGSHWGMGLLDNDGEDERDDRWVQRLGDKHNGDLVDRALVSVRPLRPFTHGAFGDAVLSVGGDHVWEDELASALQGDTAWRIVGSLVWPGDELTAGVYAVHRMQEDEAGETMTRTAVDLHAQWLLPLFLIGADVRLQGEVVGLFGETDKVRPATSPEGVELVGLGWATRAEIAWRCPRVATGIEVGYASGDGDPDDDEWRTMSFDPDFRVGLVLFPDVLRLISLRSAERIADPARVGVPPGGADLLPTDGSVQNALYLNPGVTWRPGRWTLTAMAVLAWAAEPFLDPFETFEAGGAPRNHRGERAARFYGVEAAFGVAYAFDLGDLFGAGVGVQAGGLLPGPALDGGLDDGPIGKVVGRVDLRW